MLYPLFLLQYNERLSVKSAMCGCVVLGAQISGVADLGFRTVICTQHVANNRALCDSGEWCGCRNMCPRACSVLFLPQSASFPYFVVLRVHKSRRLFVAVREVAISSPLFLSMICMTSSYDEAPGNLTSTDGHF